MKPQHLFAQFLDSAQAPAAARTSRIPSIASAPGEQVHLPIVNPEKTPAKLHIVWYTPQGGVVVTHETELAA